METPWWVLRLRHATPIEWLWRIRPRQPPRRCPPGPTPSWPWPLPTVSQAPAVHDAVFTPAFGRWTPSFHVDPKPLWGLHRLHEPMVAHLAGRPFPIDRWWSVHQDSDRLWLSSHAVAARVPALALFGHREALWAHVDHLRRHPSRFSSANNHRVAELAAMALAHRCSPALPAPEPLRPTLTAQLHADGWGREQSTAYLAHSLEWGLIAHRCGEDLADLLHAGATALEHTLADDGSAFAIGDDGNDWVLPGPATVHDVVGCIRSALGQPALSWRPSLRAQLLGIGPTESAGPPGSRAFPTGGFTVLRSNDLQVGLDHGPLGMAPLCAHGHDDLLAIWAHHNGTPWLVGRGTSAYHDPVVRRHERSAISSCGLVLGGRFRAQPHTQGFLWHSTPRGELDRVRLDTQGGSVTAHHDAYAPIRHTRTVQVDGPTLTVTDHLEPDAPTGPQHVSIRWHLAPGLTALPDGDAHHRLDSPLPVRIESQPHALSYGRTTPADTLVAEGPVRLPATLVSRWTRR